MAYATNYFPADGVQTVFDFAFAGVNPGVISGTVPYLYPEDVKAAELYFDVDGNAAALDRIVTITAPNQATIDGLPVAAGRVVKIYRKTEIRFPLVDYRDKQTVSELDLDLANRQAIFIAQETSDAASTNLQLDKFDNYNAGGHRIVNMAPGVDLTDAVNMEQFLHTLRAPAFEGVLNTLPALVDRAMKVLSFDAAGQPVTTFVDGGTAVGLTMDLDNQVDLTKGVSKVARAVVAVADFAELSSIPAPREDALYRVKAYRNGWASEVPFNGPRGGGDMVYRTGAATANGCTIFPAVGGGHFLRIDTVNGTPFMAGAYGDNSHDDTAAIQNACNLFRKVDFGNADFICEKLLLGSELHITGSSANLWDKSLSAEAAQVIIPIDAIQMITIDNVNFRGSALNLTKMCWHIQASPGEGVTPHGGLWWSSFSDITIRDFAGHGIWFDGGPSTGGSAFMLPNQFLVFYNVRIFCGKGAPYNAIHSTGQLGQVVFIQCQFESAQAPVRGTRTTYAVYMIEHANGVGDDGAYSITFDTCTFQNSRGVFVRRSFEILFDNPYFEGCDYGIETASSSRITVNNAVFRNIYNGDGTGFHVKTGSAGRTHIVDISGRGTVEHGVVGGQDVGGETVLSGIIETTVEGITRQTSTATATITLGNHRSNLVNCTGGSVNTIVSKVPAGEVFMIRALTNDITITTGGNITLPPNVTSATFRNGQTLLFASFDLGGTYMLLNTGVADRVPVVGFAAPASYSQANFQTVIDRIDAITVALKAAGIMKTT